MDRLGNFRESRSCFSLSNASANRSKASSSYSSPFARITSAKNLKHEMLPSFLRSSASGSSFSTSTPRKSFLPELNTLSSITKYINGATSPTETLLKVGKIELKQDDLRCLLSNNITKNTIDAVLTVIKHLNSKLCKKKPETKKVLIAKTKFTQKVFNNQKTNAKIDIFNINFLIFPIFVGHWTVLNFNCTELIVNYYDPLKSNKYLKDILKSLYLFLKKQTTSSGEDLMQIQLKELVYQRVTITETFSEEDSAVYMLQTIYNLSMGERVEVKSADLEHHRQEFLKMLFQHGTL